MSATRIFFSERMDARRLNRRRFLFFSAIVGLTGLATWFMADLLWRDGVTRLEMAIIVLFAILFAHIATGFCSMLVGFYVVNRGGDSCRLTATIAPGKSATLTITSPKSTSASAAGRGV